MVFFTCDSCGTALKKAQVEQHMYSCGKVVSCIDCLKEFRGNEFKAHTKCISEEEKYNGPDWKAPSSRNKGEKKQMAWVETVNAVLESGKNKLTPSQMGLLKIIAKHDNVPRKKPKFLNFIRNIAKNSFDQYTQEAVFDCLEAEWKSQAEKNKPEAPATNGKKDEAATNGKDKEDAEENGVQNGEENGKKKKSKKNKRKLEENEENMDVEVKKKKKKKGAENEEEEDNNADESQTEETEVPAEFRWGEIIEEILMAREDKSISLKKLKKKVFSEYYARVGDSKGVKSKEDLSAQLNKKLRKRKFQVVGETVKLTNVEGE